MEPKRSPSTLVDALVTLPRRPGRGFRFIAADRSERFYLYEELYQEALKRGGALKSLGLHRGDRVALVIADNKEFVLTFLGASVAGLVPVPIFPRATFKAVDGYVATVSNIVRASRARALITATSTADVIEPVRPQCETLDHFVLTERLFDGTHPALDTPERITPEDLCFLQFTSGSTGSPKGVKVTHGNLVRNAQDFLGPHGLRRNDDDVGVSWLPLYHDMGLIGFVLGTLVCDIPVVLLPTASFARMPRLWLEVITQYRGTITYAPNFAYQLVTKRLRDRDLEALDLSCLRVAGCGAEPIRAQTLRDFAERLRPTGFDGERAFLPSYGMAESTLAITFHDLGTPVVVDRVDADALKCGQATPATSKSSRVHELVGCGLPFPDHELEVVGEDGLPLPERRVGEVVVRGPSVTAGYFERPEETAQTWKNGWLWTGDLGYRADGQLFICGRSKDLIILNGANHHPQDFEWTVGELEGVRRGNVIAFSVWEEGTEKLVIAAEGSSSDAPRLRDAISQTISATFGLQPAHVIIAPVGSLPKTSSGKPQRRKARQMFEEQTLSHHV